MADDPRLLLLMRHAQAVDFVPGLGDADRPLTDAGQEQARCVGAYLAESGVRVDAVLCSAAARTRETSALLGLKAPTRNEPLIYNAGSDTIRELIGAVDPAVTTLLVVGHAPGIPTLAHALVDPAVTQPDLAHGIDRGFPPATLVGIEVGGTWSDPVPGRLVILRHG